MSKSPLLTLAAVALGLAGIATTSAHAQFSYQVVGGTVTITGYNGMVPPQLTIPSTIAGLPVTAIAPGAFTWAMVGSVSIPSSVTAIGAGAFASPYLGEVIVDPLNPAYSSVDGVLFDKSQATLIQCPANKTGNYAVPNTVTTVGTGAFSWGNLSAITIPASVTSIGVGAFSDCRKLASLVIPPGVPSLADSVFAGCISLTNVAIPNSVTSIGVLAFNNCASLTTITIPASVTSVGGLAFEGCASLEAINVDPLNTAYSSLDGVFFDKSRGTLLRCPPGKPGTFAIPDSVTNIGNSAFYSCTNLSRITVGPSVASIGDSAFSGCTALRAVCFLGNAPAFASSVFANSGLLAVYYLPGQSGWGPTFAGIQTSLWDPASQLGYTVTNNTVTITRDAGTDPVMVIPVLINGAPVTAVVPYAFDSCTWLTSVTLGANVTSIGEWAFARCTSLTNFTADPQNPSFSSNGGVLFNKSRSTLVKFPQARAGSYTIPDSVTTIGQGAFAFCVGLTNVSIPAGVTGIGNDAFFECVGLTAVSIPPGVATIGDYTFANCTGLASMTIPDTVTSLGYDSFAYCIRLSNLSLGNGIAIIGESAFNACTNLPAVRFPATLTSIGWFAFGNCTGLTNICFAGNAPTLVGSDVFNNIGNATVYVLPGTSGWGTTFGGRPTAFWVLPYPVILTTPPGFGNQGNAFEFTISWATNRSIVVEACSDLSMPTWSPVQTFTLTTGFVRFSDSNPARPANRFYRVLSP